MKTPPRPSKAVELPLAPSLWGLAQAWTELSLANLARLASRAALAPFVDRSPQGRLRQIALRAQRATVEADRWRDHARFALWARRSGFPTPGWSRRGGVDFERLDTRPLASSAGVSILARCLEHPQTPWFEDEALVLLDARARQLYEHAARHSKLRWVVALGAQSTLESLPAAEATEFFHRRLNELMPGWHQCAPPGEPPLGPKSPEDYISQRLAHDPEMLERLARARDQGSAYAERVILEEAAPEPGDEVKDDGGDPQTPETAPKRRAKRI